MGEGELRALLSRVEPEVAALERDVARTYWEATTGGGQAAEARYARAKAALLRRLSDRAEFDLLSRAEPTGDPALDRQARLLGLTFAGNQLDAGTLGELVRRETEIEGLFTRFRARVGGREVTENDLREVLERSLDPALRREAWEASQQIGAAVAPRLRELVELRNAAARRLGYPDHYTLALALQEIEPDALAALLDDLRALTAAPFAAAKDELDTELAARFATPPATLRPWHYADPFFQEAPAASGVDPDAPLAGLDAIETALRFYDGLGLDIRPALARSDVGERPGKQQHAYCIDVDRSGDVRVLLNVKPGERWMSTTLHEFGHAVYDLNHDPDQPWTLRTPAHIATTEAVALLMGRLTKDAAWLEGTAGLAPSSARALAAGLKAHLRVGQLVFARWGLVMVAFERELYQSPADDLDRRWWELKADLQGLVPPEGRHAPDWAAKIHLGTAPVYYHNYLLGEMIASQLAASLSRAAVGRPWWRTPEGGEWLRERWFRPGARWRWDELVARATGAPLDPSHYAAEFVAAP